MRKVLPWVVVLALLWGVLLALPIERKESSGALVRATAKATELAIENDVRAASAGAKASALIIAQLGLGFAGAVLAVGAAVLALWWAWVRSQTVYARGGLYPLVMRPGRRLEVYNANLLPGVDSGVTARAQAIQLSAALRGELTAGERRAALHDMREVFIEQPAPRMPEMRIVDDGAIMALLGDGQDESD